MEEETKYLLEKLRSGDYTSEEEVKIKQILHKLNMEGHAGLSDQELFQARSGMWSTIQTRIYGKKIISLKTSIAVAAIFLVLMSAGLFFYISDNDFYTQHLQNRVVTDIAPGKTKATLTLSNGKKIILSETTEGKLAEQAGIVITKTADGQVIYTAKDSKSVQKFKYNTLATANGEQYRLILPDGSKVWLNAASSIKFPETFTDLPQRRVELTGEAYFEVSKDKIHPFIVKTSSQEVKVLGTHFNISSYADEPDVKTTLLEGSVVVSPAYQKGNDVQHRERILKPGQQCVLKGAQLNIREVETDEAISWKNGEFMFTSEPIDAIMRKISRWYNVEITYKGNIANKKFTGSVSRYANVSEVLQTLALTNGINFKLNGRNIIVAENPN